MGRLSDGKDGSPSYFQDYNKNKRNLKGYEEHGYFMVATSISKGWWKGSEWNDERFIGFTQDRR